MAKKITTKEFTSKKKAAEYQSKLLGKKIPFSVQSTTYKIKVNHR